MGATSGSHQWEPLEAAKFSEFSMAVTGLLISEPTRCHRSSRWIGSSAVSIVISLLSATPHLARRSRTPVCHH